MSWYWKEMCTFLVLNWNLHTYGTGLEMFKKSSGAIFKSKDLLVLCIQPKNKKKKYKKGWLYRWFLIIIARIIAKIILWKLERKKKKNNKMSIFLMNWSWIAWWETTKIFNHYENFGNDQSKWFSMERNQWIWTSMKHRPGNWCSVGGSEQHIRNTKRWEEDKEKSKLTSIWNFW